MLQPYLKQSFQKRGIAKGAAPVWGGSFCVAYCYSSFFSFGKERSKMFLISMMFESVLIVVFGAYLLSEAMFSRRLRAF